MLIATSTNALEVYDIPQRNKAKSDAAPEATRVHSVDLPGHRTDVRTISLSSNDELLASGSNGMCTLISRRAVDLRVAFCRLTEDLEHADNSMYPYS